MDYIYGDSQMVSLTKENTKIDNSSKKNKLSTVALKTFFNIMTKWNVNVKQQIILLGGLNESTFYNYKKELKDNNEIKGTLSNDTIDRISYIIGIYKALHILLPEETAADAWIKKPNNAPLFSGKSALDIMLQGNMVNLYKVRSYLDSELGGWHDNSYQ